MDGGRIKVSTEALLAASEDVSRCVRNMRDAFTGVEKTVGNAAFFWEGSGYTAHAGAIRRRKERIDTALRRFEEHVTDLKTMAGIYAEAEAGAKEVSADLPSDLLV